MNHVVFFSSGTASWLAAKRVSDRYGTENLYLVFADTTIEDADNYRFLVEAAKNVGGSLIWLKDGRNPWDVFFEARFLSHRQSKCSIELKVKPCREWIDACEFSQENTILYFGIGFEEIERLGAIQKNWQPFTVEAPLCWEPWVDRIELQKELKQNNLKRPRLYNMGFAHANCGGFCPKAGAGHYRNLLKHLPEVYDHHEQKEQEFLRSLDRQDIGIIRKTVNGNTVPLTLKNYREIIEKEPLQLDMFEALGGCGCFIE